MKRGRPKLTEEEKKVPVYVLLPRDVVRKLDEQPVSRAKTIIRLVVEFLRRL